MAKDTQVRLDAPQPEVLSLSQHTAVLNTLLKNLFDAEHEHTYYAAAPAAADGLIGDIRLVKLTTGSRYIYVKFPDGWFRVAVA